MIISPDPRVGLRALTVRQPFASQIMMGEKRIEYRSWSTHYRGDLLITVSASPDPSANAAQRMFPRGCALCVVELWRVVGDEDEWDWYFRNPRPVTPYVKVKGKLKLWPVDAALSNLLGLVHRMPV